MRAIALAATLVAMTGAVAVAQDGFLWASLMFAASIDSLEDAGPASWQSAAILAGGTGLGAAIGKSVPRNGWVPTEPGRLSGSLPPPVVRLSLRF